MTPPSVPHSVVDDFFDRETVRRGRAYATEGHVLDHEVRTHTGGVSIAGRVMGSCPTPYEVEVFVELDGAPVSVCAECTCPVGLECKHAVALIMAASSSPLAPAPRWASLLEHSLGELEQSPQPGALRIPLGLQLDHKLSQHRWQSDPVRSLQIRPVKRGKREAWVKSGVGWSDVVYSLPYRHEHDPDQLAVLAEMAAAFGSGYGQHLDLVRLSPLVWPLLRRARDVGIELVPGAGLTSLKLADGPVAVEADMTSSGGEIEVRFGIRYDDTWWPGDGRDIVFLGGSGYGVLAAGAHGAALLHSVPPPGQRRTPHFELTLAPLAAPVPGRVQSLVGDAPLVVPRRDRATFVDDFLPRLRRQLPTGSHDASLAIPDEVPPRLLLMIGWRATHEIETSWSWQYAGSSDHRYAINSFDGLRTVRNVLAERAVLDELDLTGRSHGRMVDPSGEPIARQTWAGRELLVFANQVLPSLRESGLVEVEETGEQPDYREADGDPEVFFELGDDAATDWLDLTVRITVDDEEVPLATVLACLTVGSELVFTPSGRHVPADHPAFAKLADLVAAAGQLIDQPSDGVRVGRRDLSLWGELAEAGVVDEQAAHWVEAAQALRHLDRLPEVAPSGLKSELRGYQRSGLQWLAFLWQAGLGGILADDMGLGKTLQALALVSHARESAAAPFLVVAPTSVVSAWAHEAAAHVPGLVVRTVTASAARRGETLPELLSGADLVVTSYTLFRLEVDAYAGQDWGGLILDEAQQIKNHQGRTYHAVRELDVPFRLALTGTPFENRLMELWSLLSVVAPGLYPWPRKFKELVATPVERQGDAAALERFRRRIRPFLLRRTKEMVAADLPPKQEQVLEVDLNARHRTLYDTHLQRERQTVLGLVDDFEHNRIAIFRALTRLRLLSLDPALLDPGHDAVGSAKLEALVEHLRELISEGHRALVFSQFTSYLGRVRDRLTREDIGYAYLDGKTRRRADVIDGFKNGDAPVFLISLKAGGVGLTLTEADYVFVLDPWWNPAVEAQAVDRTHRIGQHRAVMVYRLVATDTIEQKVMELKERKAALFAQVIDGDGAMAADITADDVRAIFDG
ncbi:MAG: DEAD/DEAH box helicase [Nocardioides sp.]|nr:DEAD/DEAH box helicase [Nocardioides sp.]